MAARGLRTPLTFWAKLVGAGALIVLADRLFLFHHVGTTVGAFLLAWTALVAVTHPEVRRDRRALTALAAAALLALVQVHHVSLLAFLLFGTALSLAVLLPRSGRFDDAWRWAQRLAFLGVASLIGPILDARRLRKAGAAPDLRRAPALLRLLVLPLAGGTVFLLLFAAANPVIADILAQLRLPRLEADSIGRVVIWGVVFLAVWGILRPRRLRKPFALPASGGAALPGVSPASVTLSLVVFNALFALQNGLDLVYLWSAAGPPPGLTLAEYAHRGAYPLIATALLAGLFVLVALSPGSETARRPWVRRLVVVWLLQNVFLVASTMLRTVDYVEAYALTPMRIAALAWMVLVALGVALIGWRMLRGRSAAWLVNANTAAALTLLTLAATLDLNGMAAAWNVRHAREVGGRGAALDLCYLRHAGGSALVPLTELEAGAAPGLFRDRVTAVRADVQSELAERQADWRGWTLRGASRLRRAEQLQGTRPVFTRALPPGERGCDGALRPPPPPPPVVAPPQTDALDSSVVIVAPPAPLTQPARP